MMRRTYTDTGDDESLATFDRRLNDVLAQVPFKVPPQVRQAYGLGSDTAAPPGNLQQSIPGREAAPDGESDGSPPPSN